MLIHKINLYVYQQLNHFMFYLYLNKLYNFITKIKLSLQEFFNYMGISNQEQVLVPSKFIALMLHLIVTTMNYFSYVFYRFMFKPDNILIAYPSVTSMTDTLYIGGRTSFLAANTLIIIFLVAEFIILLVGVNMFKEKHSLFTSTLHFLGAILGAAFTFQYWQFDMMWALWFVFSFIPLSSQIFMIITAPKRA